MAWIPGRFNFFSPDRPSPSLLHTAAATSLTSFINVSGQPYSRKRWRKLFPAKSYMPADYRIFGRFSGFFPWWKPPTLVGGERSEKEERPLMMAVKSPLKLPFLVPAARAQRQRSASEYRRLSRPENFLIVPSQHFLGGSELFNLWQTDFFAVHAVIFDTVVELFLDFLADLNFVIRCHREISQVK